MQFKLRLLTAVAFLLVACGGGGSSNGPLSLSTVDAPTSGIAVDGYLVGSTVSCDVDGTGLPSAANFTADALTDSGGRFTFSKGCPHGVIVTGGRNQDTELSFRGMLRAPAGATVVTPLSTLIAAMVAKGKPVADALDLVNKSLGLNTNTDLLNIDPAKHNGTSFVNLALLKANLVVQQLLQDTTDNMAALDGSFTHADTKSLYAVTASALADTLASDLRPLNTEIVAAFIKKAAEDAAIDPLTNTDIKAVLDKTYTNPITHVIESGPTRLAQITAEAVNIKAQRFADPTKITSVTTLAQVADFTKAVQSDTGIAQALAQSSSPLSGSAKSIADAIATTTVTTTTTSTLASTLPKDNFLNLASDAVSLDDGTGAIQYPLTQFETGAGIPIRWPLANTAAIGFTLANVATFGAPMGQTYRAALSVTDPASQAQVSAYVDSVTLRHDGSNIIVSVPSSAAGRVYFRSADGTESLCAWSRCGGGPVVATMGTNFSMVLGQLINNAVNSLSSSTPRSGKYNVTLVVSGLPIFKADGATSLLTYDVSVPNGTTNPTVVTGYGLQGSITVTNNNVDPTTTTTTSSSSSSSSTVATTTTTTLAPQQPFLPGNFLYLTNDSISFDDGSNVKPYTLTEFQTDSGIPVQWPLANTAALKFTVADGGAFSVQPGQTYSAALSITDTSSQASVKAYVESIALSKTSGGFIASIPSSAAGRVYIKSADGTETLCAWTSCGGGSASTTLSTDPSQPSSIVLGQIINKAVSTLSSSAPKTGKYIVTMVVSNLPISKADRTPLPTYAVSVPNGTVNPTLVIGAGLQGYITVTNNNLAPTTTSTTSTSITTTTTSSTTTSTLSPWLSYLTLVNDTLDYYDGAASTSYTQAQFQASPGILIKWPMADAAAIGFTLTETGTYAPLSMLPLTAALSLTDRSSQAKIKAYIDNVKVTRGANNSISITIPSSANALVYGLNRDGTQALLVPVSNLVSGVNNTLGTGQNNIVLGSVINNAVSNAGSSFTGVNALTGTYEFTLVVTDLPLRQANGTVFPVTTITVPTSLSGSSVRIVTGAGLTGFVTLAP